MTTGKNLPLHTTPRSIIDVSPRSNDIESTGGPSDKSFDITQESMDELIRKANTFDVRIAKPKELYHNIELKIRILSDRDKILQIKVSKYQRKNENLNMFIIFISSILGIYETFRAKIDDIIKSQNIDIIINLVPIVLSGIITCTASIIKLKKYQEKSDNIHLTREKVSVAKCKLKTVQEHLLFCKDEANLQKIKKHYFHNAYDFYCEGTALLDKYVKEIDYRRYGTKISYSKKYSEKTTMTNNVDEETGTGDSIINKDDLLDTINVKPSINSLEPSIKNTNSLEPEPEPEPLLKPKFESLV